MGDVTVREFAPDEWPLKRDLRLAGLRESPSAFLSTYDREVGRGEAEWRSWGDHGAVFGAWLAGDPAGICAAYVDPEGPADVVYLVAMWVAPAARGRGVAGHLAGAVVDWARGRPGSTEVHLEVAPGNEAALRAYRRCGFQTADRAPLIAGGSTMALAL